MYLLEETEALGHKTTQRETGALTVCLDQSPIRPGPNRSHSGDTTQPKRENSELFLWKGTEKGDLHWSMVSWGQVRVGKVSLSLREESKVSIPGKDTGTVSVSLFPAVMYGFLELVAI